MPQPNPKLYRQQLTATTSQKHNNNWHTSPTFHWDLLLFHWWYYYRYPIADTKRCWYWWWSQTIISFSATHRLNSDQSHNYFLWRRFTRDGEKVNCTGDHSLCLWSFSKRSPFTTTLSHTIMIHVITWGGLEGGNELIKEQDVSIPLLINAHNP